MNEILRKTHIKENIELLKARDYYFDIAKRLNLIKTIVVSLPPALLLAIYLLSFFNIDLLSDGYTAEIGIGILTAAVAFWVYLIDYFIQKHTGISNQLRHIYDHKVLDVKYNPHMYQSESIAEYLKKAQCVTHSSKYEVWYSEVFSDNHKANVFCCQIDNLLYAKHAYKKAKKFYITVLVVFSAFVLGAVLFTALNKEYITAFLIAFAVLECYDTFVSKIGALNSALDICTSFCNFAKNISPESLDDSVLEQAQEVVNKNRELSIFLPRIIRKQFLEDDNPFYRELNEYKNRFMGEAAEIPEAAEDIEVVFEDGSDSVSLCEVQKRLASMLKRVVKVFDENDIKYVLDGGTLIGAMRRSTRGFIPWDDDIDITIPLNQVEKAKAALLKELDYVVQDAENEPFYSTRLSVFKIRESNRKSMVSEKDSLLYKEYKNKGLFIDVYAFSPILISRFVDRLFRRLIIHPINRKLEKIENGCLSVKKQHKRFLKAKKRHSRILAFYESHAKNNKWYAYFPGYIYDLSKSGPYHPASDIYGDSANFTKWEGEEYKIPANPDAVLTAYYGKNWETPPFCGKEELVSKYGYMWYSKAPTRVTALKHISNLLFYDR